MNDGEQRKPYQPQVLAVDLRTLWAARGVTLNLGQKLTEVQKETESQDASPRA